MLHFIEVVGKSVRYLDAENYSGSDFARVLPWPHGSRLSALRAAMATLLDHSRLLSRLLEGGHSTIAGRLTGAFRNSGRHAVADEIVRTMAAAGYDVREHDPFADRPAVAKVLEGLNQTIPSLGHDLSDISRFIKNNKPC